MSAEDFRRWLTRVPFKPFRFVILEAAKFEVHHPDAISFRVASIDFFPHTIKPLSFSEEFFTVALRHITRIEPVPVT
jgi:hypothetical protein